jgi:hypothetical protein
MDVFVGIDPGSKGYLCALAPSIGKAEFIECAAKPILIAEFLDHLENSYQVNRVMIEDVHSIFGANAKSNFNFGFNLGLLHGICLSQGFGIDIVNPKVWQKFIGVKLAPVPKDASAAEKKKINVARKKQLKESVGKICERLYPDINIRGPNGGLLDGKSDSLAIAHYAYQNSR